MLSELSVFPTTKSHVSAHVLAIPARAEGGGEAPRKTWRDLVYSSGHRVHGQHHSRGVFS